jgi:transposase-like protein
MRRGLPDPLLVISDGTPGLIRAIEECFPRSARQCSQRRVTTKRWSGVICRRKAIRLRSLKAKS